MTRVPVPLPSQLPPRLTITLWDFSWYVRTGPGEPFEDLDTAFAEAVERGYNTVRICAMPVPAVRQRPGHHGAAARSARRRLRPAGPLVRRARRRR